MNLSQIVEPRLYIHPNSSRVITEDRSSYGDPTLEIQKPNGVRIKIRYGE